MKQVFLDSDVISDLILTREPFFEDSIIIFENY